MAETLRSDRILTTVLSWVAGYVDTASFLGLDGLFTAHVTGNLVVAGAEIVGEGGEAVWVRLAIIPVFLAAVVLTTVIAQIRQPHPSSFLGVEAIALLIFTAVSVTLVSNQKSLNPLTMFVAGSTGVFAMGIQNTLMREALGHLAQTTVMTGNLTQFTIDFVKLGLIGLQSKTTNLTEKTREIKKRISKFICALLGFIFGSALGAFFTGLIGFWSILLPTVAIAFLALYVRQYEQAV